MPGVERYISKEDIPEGGANDAAYWVPEGSFFMAYEDPVSTHI